MTVPDESSCVYVVSTPIGNLEDLSPRALTTLRRASLLVCEDTRRTARLCSRFAVKTRRISLHAHNEARRIPGLLARLDAGESIALVSDAGTPLLSDPGARLVRAALERGHRVVPVPGPSAILAALVASGMPAQPFTFVGFPPRRGGARSRWLERLSAFPGAIVLFEAPGRVQRTLDDLFAVLGPRQVAVARELTKRFEQLLSGRLGELETGPLRGEVTLVIEPAEEPALRASPDDGAINAMIDRYAKRGWSTRDTGREVAQVFGLSRSDAYERVLRRGSSSG